MTEIAMAEERQEIESNILRFVQTELIHGETSLGVQDDLLTEGLVDSMGMMWLLQFVEEEFQTSIPVQDVTIENFGTVHSIATYVSQRTIQGYGRSIDS